MVVVPGRSVYLSIRVLEILLCRGLEIPILDRGDLIPVVVVPSCRRFEVGLALDDTTVLRSFGDPGLGLHGKVIAVDTEDAVLVHPEVCQVVVLGIVLNFDETAIDTLSLSYNETAV